MQSVNLYNRALACLFAVCIFSGAAEPGYGKTIKARSGTRAKVKAKAPATNTLTKIEPQLDLTVQNESRKVLQHGATLHKEGRLNEAEDVFRKVLVMDPKNADAFFNLGALAEGRGDLVTALGHYRAALALNPQDLQIKEAVSSMEESLQKGQSKLGYAADAAPFVVPTPVLAPSPVVVPLPLLSSDPLPVQSGSTFQLQSNQNVATPPVLTVGSNAPSVPTVPVSQNSQPLVRPPSRAGIAARSALGMAVNIGASYALRGTGLHCPVCRLVRLRF